MAQLTSQACPWQPESGTSVLPSLKFVENRLVFNGKWQFYDFNQPLYMYINKEKIWFSVLIEVCRAT